MVDVCNQMVGETESSDKCREARRHRITMRRFSAASVEHRPEKRKFTEAEKEEIVGKRLRPSSSEESSSASAGADIPVPVPEPASTSGKSGIGFGVLSVAGRSREMEDAVTVRPGFFRTDEGRDIDFFAVFDGHGGSHISALCKERMHTILSEELSNSSTDAQLRTKIEQSYRRMDDLALKSCACGKVGEPLCQCERSGIESEIVGSTAVVSLVDDARIVVANCGDSRAVLGRDGRAIALSDDHKPDRPDELARIQAAGGRVIYLNGPRVHGILAMSRAVGDKYLKPFVISEPEIKIVERTPEDECLIIASDGLWDVVSNDLACDIARRCLQEADPSRETDDLSSSGIVENAPADPVPGEEQASDPRCYLAATLLARLALGRKSADNISVIVIDLRKS